MSAMQAESVARGSGAMPPGPKGIPVLGHLTAVGRDPLSFFTECARTYGDIVPLRFGAWPALLLSDPDDIEIVLVKQHRNFVKNSFFWRQVTAIFGLGLLTNEGEAWHKQRRLAAPAFAGKQLLDYGETMVAQTTRMLDGWRDGEVRDIHHDMMALTLGIAAKTLFNAEVEEDVAAIDASVNELVTEIASRFSRPVLIPDWVPLPGHIRYRRALRRIEEVVARMIAERRAGGEETHDFLSMLMAARDENGEAMSDKQLRDEAITLLLAGHETTALVLSWTLYVLGQRPDVAAKLAVELDDVLEGRPPSVEDLPKLTYTESVINEAMRIYPPAWVIGREAVEDCEIGGHTVPAGTTIMISNWVIQRDPRHFDAPEEYRPERWLDGLAKRLPRFAYFPFGGGPRVCIGNRFAMMEAVLLLAAIMQRYTVTWQSDRPVTPQPSITLRPGGGVWLKLEARG